MSLADVSRVLDVVAVGEKYAPGLRVTQKTSSWLHRLVGKFSASYLADFWTTLPRRDGSGSTIYRPSVTDADTFSQEFSVIDHEVVHAVQVTRFQQRLGKRLGAAVYALAYAFPQWLAVVGLLWSLAVVGCWFFGVYLAVWPSLLMVAGAPLPAPYRTKAELEAYMVTAAADYWYRGGMSALETEAWVQNVSKYFTSSAYYYMAWYPGGSWVRDQLRTWFKMLRSEEPQTKTPYLSEVKRLCDRYAVEDSRRG